ncbi:MAG: polysaccharide lyase family 7 protein [Cyclobacteriaceae bacterium]
MRKLQEKQSYKSAWTDDESHYYDEIVNNDAFDLEIIASAGRLEIIMNNASKVYEDASMQAWPFENYFKAGNYLQSTKNEAFAKVEFYSLKVTH